MSTAATRVGATVPREWYNERASDRERGCARATSDDHDKRDDRRLAAVAQTLRWADEAAEHGDHVGAVAWLNVVEAIGEELPRVYETRRHAWVLAIRAGR
jgi:hypothetical protein